MNYAKIKAVDVANGDGCRVSLFVSGCRHHCKGCFNKEAWDFNYGEEYTPEVENRIMELLKPYYIKGLSILGGDPMEKENYIRIRHLLQKVKNRYPNKTVWFYTGCKYEDIMHDGILNYIDVLVDGEFVEDLKDLNLRFRGSSNQRIIHLTHKKRPE